LDIADVYAGGRPEEIIGKALAETVRLTSNSRTPTYKLHLRPEDEIRNRLSNSIKTFEGTMRQSILRNCGWRLQRLSGIF